MRQNGIYRQCDERVLGFSDLFDYSNAVDDYVWPNLREQPHQSIGV
jgi:hypothetical protein